MKTSSLLLSACLMSTPCHSQIAPVYVDHFNDATLNSSRFVAAGKTHWAVPAGADQHSASQYERPTNQTYKYYGGVFATEGDYFGNLDIQTGSFGYDQTYLYVKIKMVDVRLHEKSGQYKNEGLIYGYRFRLNLAESGAGSYLFTTDQPSSKGSGFTTEKNFGYRDANSDADRKGNGYEKRIISDGKLDSGGKRVLYTRINPSDPSTLEFALDYVSVGLNPAIISSIVFESNKGLQDTSKYPWNKTYSGSEAGSPNGGSNGKSEFGTSGLGNVYELDTLKGVPSGQSNTPPVIVRPPTGELLISRNYLLRDTVIPVGYRIQR